jgi:hypothetical protein
MEKRQYLFPLSQVEVISPGSYREVTETTDTKAVVNTELNYLDAKTITMNLKQADVFVVTDTTEYRPDLISLKFFDSYDYGWLLALYNGFLDPVFDFKSGTKIKIPDISDYFRFYSRNSRKVPK